MEWAFVCALRVGTLHGYTVGVAFVFLVTGAQADMTDPDDMIDLSALLWLVSTGDHLAFQRLYDREAPRLFAVALRVTADERLASEALHTALIQIWRRTAHFTPQLGTPEGWLIAQVRGRAIEIVRRRQRDGVPSDLFGRGPDIDTGLERLGGTPEADRMRAALSELDNHRRYILVLAFLDGLSAAELAQKLRLPIGTVKSWTRHGLSALRVALEAAA